MALSWSIPADASTIPPVCADPRGYEVSNQQIALDFECDKERRVCGLQLRSPLALSERQLLGFLLRFDEGKQGDVNLAYEPDEQREYAYAAFEMPRAHFKSVSVHAIYSFRETGCYLHAIWSAAEQAPELLF